MKLRSVMFFLVGSLMVSSLTIMGYHYFFNSEKIGYVKSGVLLQQYEELKLADQQFSQEMKVVSGNIDTLRSRYQVLEEIYNASTNEKEKNALAMKLGSMKYEYENYSEQASVQMEQKKQDLMKKILENINNYVQEYGKSHGYKFILGTTNEGSILYGRESDDLTEVIIKDLNEKYKDEGAKTK